jgi:hypothetical protein
VNAESRHDLCFTPTKIIVGDKECAFFDNNNCKNLHQSVARYAGTNIPFVAKKVLENTLNVASVLADMVISYYGGPNDQNGEEFTTPPFLKLTINYYSQLSWTLDAELYDVYCRTLYNEMF